MKVSKKEWNIISFLLAIGTCFGFLIFTESSKEDACKVAFLKYSEMSLNGRVSKRFVDPMNHNAKTLNMVKGDSQWLYYHSIYDVSGFFDFVEVGDSVIKQASSPRIHVIRKDKKAFFDLEFRCDGE